MVADPITFVTSDLHSECAEIGNCNPLILAGQLLNISTAIDLLWILFCSFANIDMEYYTKQHIIKPFFVSTANSMKQCFLFWSNYSRLGGRITAWWASLGRSCLHQTVVIEFVGNQLQLGIIYDSISCGE